MSEYNKYCRCITENKNKCIYYGYIIYNNSIKLPELYPCITNNIISLNKSLYGIIKYFYLHSKKYEYNILIYKIFDKYPKNITINLIKINGNDYIDVKLYKDNIQYITNNYTFCRNTIYKNMLVNEYLTKKYIYMSFDKHCLNKILKYKYKNYELIMISKSDILKEVLRKYMFNIILKYIKED